jgi:hypothetical protein
MEPGFVMRTLRTIFFESRKTADDYLRRKEEANQTLQNPRGVHTEEEVLAAERFVHEFPTVVDIETFNVVRAADGRQLGGRRHVDALSVLTRDDASDEEMAAALLAIGMQLQGKQEEDISKDHLQDVYQRWHRQVSYCIRWNEKDSLLAKAATHALSFVRGP